MIINCSMWTIFFFAMFVVEKARRSDFKSMWAGILV